MPSETHLRGAGAVFAVCAQLCYNGHTPCFPAVDDGVDIILNTGIKIQVKSSRIRHHPQYPYGCYMFDVRKGWKRKGKEICSENRQRNYAGIADFIIFVGVDENRFFIMTPQDADQNFHVPPRGKQYSTKLKIYGFEDAWHLLDVDAALNEVEEKDQRILQEV